MAGFSFGQPASSAASGNSLFGTSSSGGNAPGSLFGSGSKTDFGSGSTGFSFGGLGQTPTSSGSEQSKPLFGAASDNKPETSPFGQGSGGSAGGGSGGSFNFGPSAQDSNKPASPAPFAGFGTPAKPSTSAPSLFGSTTPAPPTTSAGFSFGGPSTTPAGPPPATNAFGASTGGASIFGQKQPTQENTTQKPAFSFGKAAEAPASANSNEQSTTGGLFGGGQKDSSSGGLFGSKPAGAGSFSFPAPPKPADKASDSSGSAPAASSAPGQKPLFGLGQQPPSSSNAASTQGANPSLFGTAGTTQASTSSLFGAAPAQPSTSQPTPGLFNTAPSGNTSSTPFGQAATTSSSESASKPTFSFPSASTQPPTSSTPAAFGGQKPLFGNLGGTTTTTSAPAPLFPPLPASSAAPASTANAATSTAAPSFSFGPPTPAAVSQPAASTATAAPGTTQTSNAAAATSTSGPLPPAQSRLRNKTMDEILTRWATDLTKYTKEFKSHAETVAKWDQLIVDNSSKIDKLYVRTRTCEKQTMSVEMQLSAVENQQTELESWLSKYENDVDEMLAKDSTYPGELGGPDQERERTYQLAERLGERLDDMGRDLENMVEEVNAANASLSKNGKADEPITQIVRILNSHLTQLQAIDQGTVALQAKLSAAQKAASGVGYMNGGASGDGRAAVDDFYRSYIGRR